MGRGGSGTIFFGHCNLLCVFCQNWEISHRGDGSEMNDEGLAALRIGLQKAGCHNISLATPTHVVPSIVGALRVAIVRGLRAPLVSNCGGYEAEEIVRLLDGIVDIYLPDFKFADSAVAERYCGGARGYAERAAAAILEMHRQVGDLVTDENGIALRGLMVRHLVLPGNLGRADKIVEFVAGRLGPWTYLNMMAQYKPEFEARSIPELAPRMTAAEYRQALDWARAAALAVEWG